MAMLGKGGMGGMGDNKNGLGGIMDIAKKLSGGLTAPKQ